MERVELIPGITRNEAAALAYFAMGVSSEGGYGGRNVAYQLSFAGSTRGNILRPVAGSRFSIGTLQVDLGQHPDVAGELMAAYRAWSAAQAVPQPISAGDVAGWTELERMLSRDGSTIRAEGGRNLSVPIRQGLDSFLESPQGVDFVHDRDLRQIDHLLRADSTLNRSALHAIAGTRLYQDADADGRVRLAAIMLKLENQSGRAIYPRLVRRIERGELEGVDAVERAIHARGDYVSTGVHHTLEGTRTYLALRDATMENPLRHAANEVLADPTIRPTTLTASGNGPSPSLAEYHAVKTCSCSRLPRRASCMHSIAATVSRTARSPTDSLASSLRATASPTGTEAAGAIPVPTTGAKSGATTSSASTITMAWSNCGNAPRMASRPCFASTAALHRCVRPAPPASTARYMSRWRRRCGHR